MSVTHSKVSAKSDGGDSTLVLPSDWNANHVISGLGLTFVGAKAYHSTTGTPTGDNAYHTFGLDSESYDTDAFHSTSSNTERMTIPTGLSGKYLINAFLKQANSSSGYITLTIRKNGTTFIQGGHGAVFHDNNGYKTATVSFTDDAVAGDYYEYGYVTNATASIGDTSEAAGALQLSFSITKLDPGRIGLGIGCSVSGTSTSVGAAYAALAFGATDTYDPDGFHDPSTNNTRITIPAGMGGIYVVEAHVGFGPSQSDRRVAYRINGGTDVILERLYIADGGAGWTVATSKILQLSAGDYLEISAYQDSTSTLTVYSAELMRLDSSGAVSPSYLGYNAVGASYEATVNSVIYAKQITPSSDGMLVSIDAYIKGNATNAGSFGCAVYTNNSGSPGVLLAATPWPTAAGTPQANLYWNSTTPGWLRVPISCPVTGGTSYWIAFYLSDNGGGGNGAVNIAYDTGSDYKVSTAYVLYTPTWSSASRKYSIRTHYQPQVLPS